MSEQPPVGDNVAQEIIRSGKQFLRFQPHGYKFPIELPVITKGSREEAHAWTWNGSLDKPTLRPSIRTVHGGNKLVSHLWLNDGLCQHLADSTDGLAGQTLPLMPLDKPPAVHGEGVTRIPYSHEIRLRESDTIILKSRNGERRIHSGKFWVNRRTPVGEEAELWERKPYGGNKLIQWKDVIAVERKTNNES